MPSYSGVFTLQAQMQAIAAGNWPGYVPPIGAAFGGGFFAGQISTSANGVPTHNLVVGPVASAQNNSVQWKTTNTSTSGTSSDIDGPANSAAMNDANHPAAQFCEGLTIGGFSDWYMPAKNELEVCYYNLKPTTAANNTSSGINANAVPARASTYTSGDPARTTATNFRGFDVSQAFGEAYYWSSTEFSSTAAWWQYFPDGRQSNVGYTKISPIRVRAIRRIPV